MKKVVVFLMCLCFVATAHAYTECVTAGGTEITRNVNGTTNAPSTCTPEKCPATTKTFCKSSQKMNWWTAFNWCASINGSLADFSAMCPNVQTAVNNTTSACPGLQGKGSDWVWSSLGYGSDFSIIVNLSSGAVGYSRRHSTNGSGYSALCE